MVEKIVWSKKSLTDLRAIYEYISRDSLFYADLSVQQTIHKTELIKAVPLAGKIVPEFGNNSLREFIHKNYRIIYRIKDTTAYVVRIFHSSRLLTRL